MTDATRNASRRNCAWYGPPDRDGFIHRSWMKNQGCPDPAFDGRPTISICNTRSELTPCSIGLRDLAEGVKRGGCEAGGFPVEFPDTSLGETRMTPTAMLFHNQPAMDGQECIRAYGLDGVLLLGGCDKPAPGQQMGAALVFENIEDMTANIDRDDLPRTAYGTVILHVSPEAQAGGAFALVRTGDRIKASASQGVLGLRVSDAGRTERRKRRQPDPAYFTRGYAKLRVDRVRQAHPGADLDFLVGKDKRPVTRESH